MGNIVNFPPVYTRPENDIAATLWEMYCEAQRGEITDIIAIYCGPSDDLPSYRHIFGQRGEAVRSCLLDTYHDLAQETEDADTDTA